MANQYIKNQRYTPKIDSEKLWERAERLNELIDFDLGASQKYTNEQKLHAVVVWLLTRNMNKVSVETGIPLDSLKHYKYRTDWWPRVEQAVKVLKNEELDRKLSDIVDYAMDEVFDRLEHGEEVVLRDGSKTRKKVSAKDLMTILGISYDKRALIRGDPTARIEKKDNVDQINKLAEQFKKIASNNAYQIEAEKVKTTYTEEDVEDGIWEEGQEQRQGNEGQG